MKIFGYEIARKSASGMSLDTLINRLEASFATYSGVAVTPETCMQAPTVHAIVTAISRRIAILPIKVMQATTSNSRTKKEELPNHPVAKLLAAPNDWQDRVSFWLDATSWLVRYGNFYAFKSRGSTGPIRQLIPLRPDTVAVEQDLDWNVTYRAAVQGGGQQTFTIGQLMHARGAARDGIKGNSPVMDVREAIALEIVAEQMGASVFGNGAQPGMIFKHGPTSRGFKTEEEEKRFIDSFQAVYAKRGRFKSMILPAGMDMTTVGIENEKAQFLATRQYQRSVIAGAFGVPPHLVGDLSRGTFNNVEQQSLDFIVSVVLPYVRIFEAAMERSLLTDEDRRSGVIIRFNIDGAVRGSFKERQEGLQIQRNAGVISANDWRQHEGLNPLPANDGGDEYWRQGQSGQTAAPPGSTQPPPPDTEDDTAGQDRDEGAEDERNA